MKEITIITTGGTIEKTYNESDGTLSNQGSVLKAMLSRLRLPACTVKQTNLIAKDSLYLKDEDRRKILEEIHRHLGPDRPVVVLHGTDTMEHTARLVFEKAKDLPAPVIFTGAMKPYGFEDSDALQNLNEALFAACLLDPKVYIVFHGQALPAPNIAKNRTTLTFETIENPA